MEYQARADESEVDEQDLIEFIRNSMSYYIVKKQT